MFCSEVDPELWPSSMTGEKKKSLQGIKFHINMKLVLHEMWNKTFNFSDLIL